MQDVDRISWKQDLTEDRNRIARLLNHAKQVSITRDAKLMALRKLLGQPRFAPRSIQAIARC